ncbi:MAG TPA: DUF481 domain-containing protein [Longimicrobiales bacterium]|nr:DUF481 domain-containing protein [Longimicrobiales bacterium]
MLKRLYSIVLTCLLFPAALNAQQPDTVPAPPVPDSLAPVPDTLSVPVTAPAPLAQALPSMPQPEPEPDRWMSQLEFGFNGSRGNTDLITLSTGFSIEHREKERFELEWATSYRYGESENEVVARHLQSSISFDLFPAGSWSPFFYVAAERDPFKRIDLRTDGGAGAKYTIARGDVTSASLSLALLHTYENFRAIGTDPAPETRNNARWSVRARALRRMNEGWQVENTTFYKPVHNELGDYDIDSTTKLSAILNSRLALTFSYKYRLDSTPAEGVGGEDQFLTAGLTINL